MPYPYTAEQIRLATSVDLPMFLELRGEHFESAGKEKKLIYIDGAGRHDSITMRDNRWYDHKNQQGGGPIQFMQMFYGMSFTEAVGTLLGQSVCCQPRARPSPTAEEKRAEFELPKANSNMHRVYAYLIKQRFIAPEIITHFAKAHTLYEDAEHHNAVFVGLDENGKPVAASKRSTSTYGSSFRMTCAGSDTRYSFAHYGTSDKLFIFEAPIDMLSFLTLYPEHWQEHSYIALNGVYEHPALRALETHAYLQKIILCTDHDPGGQDGAERLADLLRERGYTAIKQYVPRFKDWNEILKARHGMEALPAVPHRQKEEYFRQAAALPSIRCPPEKLTERIRETHAQKQYTDLAAYALAGAAFLMPGCDVQDRLTREYRAYTDKGHIVHKQTNLRSAVRDAVQNLRQYAYTELQRDQCAHSLMHLADCALRVSVEQALEPEQQPEEEPEFVPALS